MKIKIYSSTFYSWIDNSELVSNPKEADIVILPGGADIDPSLYKHKNIKCHWFDTEHDKKELDLLASLNPKKQLAIGICRGAQLINVFNGGKLIQDVNHHLSKHDIKFLDDDDPNIYTTTSCHHQMCYPWTIDYNDFDILACSFYHRSDYYISDGLLTPPLEPEIIYFNKTNMLGIQGHPEWCEKDDEFVKKLNEIILNYL